MRPLISDQPYIVLDSTRAKEELGWRPKIRLEEGLQMVVDYWKAQPSHN
jgi:nucleoside-diphosphate-sugar epimerase